MKEKNTQIRLKVQDFVIRTQKCFNKKKKQNEFKNERKQYLVRKCKLPFFLQLAKRKAITCSQDV